MADLPAVDVSPLGEAFPLRKNERTSPEQVLWLRAFFGHEDAQDWTQKERLAFTRALRVDSRFSNLSAQQIKYQWDKFAGEHILRKEIGSSYYHASVKMANQEFLSSSFLLEVVEKWRSYFDGNPNPEWNLPTIIYEFMKRNKVALSQDKNGFQITAFTMEDDDKLQSLIAFASGMITCYAGIWADFAVMSANPSVKVTSQPGLILADLELELTLKRKEFASNPEKGGPLDAMLSSTFIGPLVKLSRNEQYKRMNEQPPDYINSPWIQPGANPMELTLILFVSLENAIYSMYSTYLPLMREDMLEGKPKLQSRQVFYFIASSAFHASIGLLDFFKPEEKRKREMLLATLSLKYEVALSEGLPAGLCESRSKQNLLCVSSSLFNVVYDMEVKVLTPLLQDHRLLSLLKSRLPCYLERQLAMHSYPLLFMNVFEKSLGYAETDEEAYDDIFHLHPKGYLPLQLANKFYRYYVGSSFNDFTSHKMRFLLLDKDPFKNLSFRVAVLTQIIKKQKRKLLKASKKTTHNKK